MTTPENTICLIAKAPRRINKNAARFKQLATLLSANGRLAFDVTSSGVVITGFWKDGPDKTRFTMQEVGDACPPLAELFQHVLANDEAMEASYLESSVKTVWSHCCNNSMLIYAKGAIEVYATRISRIERPKFTKGEVIANAYNYTLHLEKTGDGIRIVGGETPGYEQRAELMSVELLENFYPGFKHRLDVGAAMGLSSEELAAFSCSVDSAAILDNSSKILPDYE